MPDEEIPVRSDVWWHVFLYGAVVGAFVAFAVLGLRILEDEKYISELEDAIEPTRGLYYYWSYQCGETNFVEFETEER